MVKEFLKKIILHLLHQIHLKRKYIVFESYPDYDGSPWMIHQELTKRNYDKKYKFIWFTGDDCQYKDGTTSKIFFGKKSLINSIKFHIILWNTKLIIDSNRYIEKENPQTIRLHTRHGGTLKKADSYSNAIGMVDYILSLSDEMAKIEAESVYRNTIINPSNFLTLGYPNNDRLFDNNNPNICNFIHQITKNNVNYKKIIGWMPTFRKHKENNRIDSSKELPLGLPLLYKSKDVNELNSFLQKRNILLVIKIHHAQLVEHHFSNLSNIIIIPKDIQDQMSISTMDLLKSFDALITDYSSIYHEFILLNRPTALSIDDIESYSSGTGFSIDYFEWIKGVYLKTAADIFNFIDEVAKGIDSAKKEREASKLRIHKYIDNKSTQRVVDFLEKKAKL